MTETTVPKAEIYDEEPVENPVELPEGVTEEPRNEEEMNLKTIIYNTALVHSYLAVSDDKGEMLGDEGLEAEVIECCQRYRDIIPRDNSEAEAILQVLIGLSSRYVRQINKTDNISIGITTKYRIREGMLFNIQKTIVTDVLQLKWMPWFSENYGLRLLRSVQDYMRLARVSNIIRYAVFGKEQLLEIIRQIGEPEGDDPIGDFLMNMGIDFDPEAEVDIAELKRTTDIAIARKKLNGEGLESVNDDKVEALVRNGVDLTKSQLQNLKLVMETSGDLTGYVDTLIATGGKAEPVLTPETKAKSFKRTVDRFLNQANDAIEDQDYLGELSAEICQQIIEKIQQLEQRLTIPAN